MCKPIGLTLDRGCLDIGQCINLDWCWAITGSTFDWIDGLSLDYHWIGLTLDYHWFGHPGLIQPTIIYEHPFVFEWNLACAAGEPFRQRRSGLAFTAAFAATTRNRPTVTGWPDEISTFDRVPCLLRQTSLCERAATHGTFAFWEPFVEGKGG